MTRPTLDIAVSADPIIIAIQNFRVGLAAFNAMPDSQTQEEGEAKTAQTYGPSESVLMGWNQPAQSYAGAVEAIRLAADENADYNGSEIADRMVKAALAYFDFQDGRTAG